MEDYQPVISKRTWLLLLAVVLLFMIYITVSSQDLKTVSDPGMWSAVTGKLSSLNTKEVSKIWQTGMGLFTSISPVAFLILIASMALWTLDSFLTRLNHRPAEIHVK